MSFIRISDEEKKNYFRDFILWKQEGFDIDKKHCLFFNFGANLKLEYPQIRSVNIDIKYH